MNLFQRFFKRILPKQMAHEMEMSSRQWMVKCPNCAKETSIWEMGGIRWGASGKSATRIKCSQCGQKSWVVLYKKQEVPVPEREVELDEIVNKV
jgi:ribosomal protein S27E